MSLITLSPEKKRLVNTLTTVRDHYIRCFRPQARAEAAYFGLGSLEERVRNAARARTASGRKHRHQSRIPPRLLAKFADRLVGRLGDIASARSFAQLLLIADSEKEKGIGELTVYDTAFRIGLALKLEPDEVYLHAGTRIGASRLGLGIKRATIPRADLPPELSDLSISEVEDLLCIYADYFGQDSRKLPTTSCDLRLGCHTRIKNAWSCH